MAVGSSNRTTGASASPSFSASSAEATVAAGVGLQEVQDAPERGAIDVLHRHVAKLAILADKVDPGDVRVIEPGHRLRFAAEPGDVVGPVQGVAQNLQRDHAVQRDLPRLVDDPHPPRAQPTFDHEVADPDGGLQRGVPTQRHRDPGNRVDVEGRTIVDHPWSSFSPRFALITDNSARGPSHDSQQSVRRKSLAPGDGPRAGFFAARRHDGWRIRQSLTGPFPCPERPPRMRLPRLRVDWFLCGIGLAIALAWVVPGPGAAGGWLHPDLLTKGGVALIFFLHGLGLSFAALGAGMVRWRLHLVVQTATFVVFPALSLALVALAGSTITPDLRLGFGYLGALPSTVSSSVAMTAAARGNVASAIFNATLSSLLGVFLTPVLVGWMMTEGAAGSSHALPLGKVILDLILWLVLPLVVGQSLRPLLAGWAARNKRWTSKVDRGTILVLVYTSFCDSVERGVWTGQGGSVILATVVGSVVILATMLGGINLLCRWLGFPTEDRIAAVFCGSKKTLASGVPMAHLIFGSSPSLGVILLPIMIYHPLQLVVCGTLAGRWARRGEEPAPAPGPHGLAANSSAR